MLLSESLTVSPLEDVGANRSPQLVCDGVQDNGMHASAILTYLDAPEKGKSNLQYTLLSTLIWNVSVVVHFLVRAGALGAAGGLEQSAERQGLRQP